MKKTSHKASAKKPARRTRVATHNGTLDIEHGLGRMKSARAIAQSLKKAADASENLTAAPFHAAMAALDHLIAFLDRQKERLEAARVELRKLYGEPSGKKRKRGTSSPARSRATARGPRKRTRRNAQVSAGALLAHLIPT